MTRIKPMISPSHELATRTEPSAVACPPAMTVVQAHIRGAAVAIVPQISSKDNQCFVRPAWPIRVIHVS